MKIIKPIITEKTLSLAEKNNQFTFSVKMGANKVEVASEVEKSFNVSVLEVKMINILGKDTVFGKKRIPGKKSDIRKAIVKLKKGDKISLFNIK